MKVEENRKTNCLIHRVKPAVCRIWILSLYCRECREGLAKYWQLAVSPLGQLEGAEEKLRDFLLFIEFI
jgi:Fe-S-cluster containining protein